MEQKKCNFCEKAKIKLSWAFFVSMYITMLVVWGQVAMIKYIIKLFNS